MVQRQLLEADSTVRDSSIVFEAQRRAQCEYLSPPGAASILRENRPRGEALATGSDDWRIAAMEHLAKHAAEATQGALAATTGTYQAKRRQERLSEADLTRLESDYAQRDAEFSAVRGTKNFFSVSPGLRGTAPAPRRRPYSPVD